VSGIDEKTYAELTEIAGRYPEKRSGLLPMLHLVQSVEGRVTPAGIEACAEILEITPAEVSGVATFYTMYKRRPVGDYHVGVCTNTLCAVMGGDEIFSRLKDHLDVGNDETTEDEPGMKSITLEHVECNAACDYAPVMMVNWEFMDNMTPESAVTLVDDLRAGKEVSSTRGPRLCSWREAERVLAGFPDGRVDEGPHLVHVEEAGHEDDRCARVEEGPAASYGVVEHLRGVAVPGPEEDVGAGVQHEVRHPLGLRGRQHRLHAGHGLVQGPQLVLQVAAHHAQADRPTHGLGGVAVATLEVRGHRQVGGGDDPADRLEHQVHGDVLTVLVAVHRGDRVAGGGKRARARHVGDHPRGDRVPDVDDGEQGGVAVEVEEGTGPVGGGGHPASLGIALGSTG